MYYKIDYDGGWWKIINRRSNHKPFQLKEENYLDYYIIKGTQNFRFVNDFSDNYSVYIVIKKDKILKEDYIECFKIINLFVKMMYKPLPPINILKKIKIINKI